MGDEVRRLAEIPTGADDPDEERRRALRDNPLYVDLDDDQPPLNMVVSVHDGKILLWSLTQREGTRDKPKLELPADDAASIGKVRDALLEIVKRNYAGKKRTPATKSAILMADERTPIALVAKLFGAMRGGTGDAEAFPDIQLSSSIR
jgi:hypothetical protein